MIRESGNTAIDSMIIGSDSRNWKHKYIDRESVPRCDIDKKIIYSPKFGPILDAQDDALVRGKNIHEAAHARLTPRNGNPSWGRMKMNICNALEDCRIERSVSKMNASVQHDLYEHNRLMNEELTKKFSDPEYHKNIKPINEALCAMMFRSQGFPVNWEMSEQAKKYFDIGKDLFETYKDLPNQDTKEGFDEIEKLADNLIAKWKEEIQKEEQKKQEEQESQKSGKGKKEDKKESDKQNQKSKDSGDSQDGKEGENQDQEGSDGSDKESDEKEGSDKEGSGRSKKDDKKSKDSDKKSSKGGSGDSEDGGEEDDDSQDEGSEDGDEGDADGDNDSDNEESDNGGQSSDEGSGSAQTGGHRGSVSDEVDYDQDMNNTHKHQEGNGESKNYGEQSKEKSKKEAEKKAEKQLEEDFEDKDVKEEALNEKLKEILKESLEDSDGFTSYRELDRFVEVEDFVKEYEKARNSISVQIGRLGNYTEEALKYLSRCQKMANLEKGRIDKKKLCALSKSLTKKVFYKVKDGIDLDCAVTILVDESGSIGYMQYALRTLAIAFSEVFHKLNIKFEVLGFTTFGFNASRSYSDGFMRTVPIKMKVYKAYKDNYNLTKYRLGGIRSECHNADGESVLYAYQRLKKEHVRRKIIFVLSDGAPCCNENDWKIGQHLRKVVKDIRNNGDEIYAFGIGTNAPETYYGKDFFIYLNSIEDLGPAFFNRFKEVIAKK